MALLSTRQFFVADLYTFYLLSGGCDFTNVAFSGNVIRITDAAYDIVSNGNLFSSMGPLIERSKFSWKIGIAVDTLQMTVYPVAENLINDYPFLQAIQYGMLDGADNGDYEVDGNLPTGQYKVGFSGPPRELDGSPGYADASTRTRARSAMPPW